MSNRRLVHRCLLGAVLAVPATLLGIFSLGFAQEPPRVAFPTKSDSKPLLQVAQADGPKLAAGAVRKMLSSMDIPGGLPVGHPEGAKLRKTGELTFCINCHTAKNTAAAKLTGWGDGKDPNDNKRQDDNWVLLNEFKTWNEADKHHGSYIVLLQEKSQQMARIMGVVDENKKSQIHRDIRCIACHSGISLPELEMDANSPGLIAEDMVQRTELNRGVSCEGCHGTSEGIDAEHPGWNTEHISKWKWRFLDPHIKSEKFGYYDVRSPVSRTRMCLSCHVGNVKEGRVVTHEMYAAGHPPLPGFEVETFSVQEPQHWRNFHKKSKNIRDEFLDSTKEWRKDEYREDDLHNTRDLLIGACVNLSEMLNLTIDLADPDVTIPIGHPRWSSGKKGDWPEFAQFSCFACHHDLEDQGWRLLRDPVGTPGRPPLHEWPFVLAEFAVRATAGEEQGRNLLSAIAEIQQVAVDGPFGNTEVFISKGRKLANDLQQFALQLEDVPLPKDKTSKIINDLITVVEDAQKNRKTLDYDSARQVVWAIRIIYDDAMDIEPNDSELYSTAPLEERSGWYKEDDPDLSEFQKALVPFRDLLLVDLRTGVRNDQLFGNDKRPVLKWDAKAALAPAGAYNPEKVLDALRGLRAKTSQIKVGATN